MAQLLGIRIRNFRSLADVTLGQIGYGQGEPLSRFSCFIGPNGSGKSSLLDAFGFLADCLKEGVEAACDKPARGGFERLRTQGQTGPISFDLYYKENANSRPISYALAIDNSASGPFVRSESLKQRRNLQKKGQPLAFLTLNEGEGHAWAGEASEGNETDARHEVKIETGRLAITQLGSLKDHPRISQFRAYLEGWYLSYFVPDAARTLPPVGAQRHLDRTGSNLGNYVQYLKRIDPPRFDSVLRRVAQKIPGLKSIDYEESADKRLLLKFGEAGYQDPFFQGNMSDGTLKLFAYFMLLEDPAPFPLIGIEEPENGLYHRLLRRLAEEFKEHTRHKTHATQILVTTHSPSFVDALQPADVWLIQKNDQGVVEAQRTDTIGSVSELYSEGLPMGSLWFSNHFQERGEFDL